MTQIRTFIEWLSFRPTASEIARALTTEHLAPYGASSVRIVRIKSDGSYETLGNYGTSNEVLPITGTSPDHWAPSSQLYVATLRDRGVLQGHLIVEFANPVAEKDKHQFAEAIEDFSVPISLYLSFQTLGSSNFSDSATSDNRDAGSIQLTQRQIFILRGMVEGKTNHELATDMGFSVSTIRHETMRIYQALAVSDRKEAAKKAVMLSII